jgi:YihY family inner membrane protein
MSVKEKKLEEIRSRVFRYREGARDPGRPRFLRFLNRMRAFFCMLHFEWTQNDVTIRAESLSYYTLFSFMPLMAGIFLLLGFFSQWGPLQQEFEQLLGRLLGAIPEEQKETLLHFILQFRDQYLANLGKKSGSIGVFAVGILLWIGARVFFNIESLMNRIWGVDFERPFLERVKNFFFCMVLLPLVYGATLSIPRILEFLKGGRINPYLDQGVFGVLVFFSLAFVLKFFPNTRVSWKSAQFGALLGTLGFSVAQFLLRFYFQMGTETAYGKAAVLPLFAFFIYVSWVIFIVTVEVSLLVERGEELWRPRLPTASLSRALLLVKAVQELRVRFERGEAPLTEDELATVLSSPIDPLREVLGFLEKKQKVMRTDRVALVNSVTEEDLIRLIKDLLEVTTLSRDFDLKGLISRLA